MSLELSIRPLQTIAEMHAVEEVQRAVWPGDETTIVPAHLLLTAAHNGGVVLGAFLEQQLVGFAFGFAGLQEEEPRLKLCSHMLGVLPSQRNRHLGRRLKWAQRAWALQQGYELITWTYDPLEARNAYLNIHVLGAVCHTYLPNEYGAMNDALNAGLPSDRFQVRWWITSERVEQRHQGANLPPSPAGMPDNVLNSCRLGPTGPRPPDSPQAPSASLVWVEIPRDFQTIKRRDPALALAWRQHSRRLFLSLFAQGYELRRFVRVAAEGAERAFYGLQRSP